MNEAVKNTLGLSLMVECEECGQKFPLSSDADAAVIQHKKEYKVNGRSIYLTYYVCPSCGNRHFVQIDDEHTLRILKENRRLFVTLAAKRANDRPVPKSQSGKYKKKTRYLRECRMELMEEFTGIMLHDDETEESFELRFSV